MSAHKSLDPIRERPFDAYSSVDSYGGSTRAPSEYAASMPESPSASEHSSGYYGSEHSSPTQLRYSGGASDHTQLQQTRHDFSRPSSRGSNNSGGRSERSSDGGHRGGRAAPREQLQTLRRISGTEVAFDTGHSSTSQFFAASRYPDPDDELLPEACSRSTRASRKRDIRPGAQLPEPPPPDRDTIPEFFGGGFNERECGLQQLHEHASAHSWEWDGMNAARNRPEYRKAGNKDVPTTKASANIVERTGIFEGGRGRIMRRKEAEGEYLAEDTGVHAVFRPKKHKFGASPDTALKRWSDCDFCARVGPESRCFCGFTFIEHAASARMGGSGNGDNDFAWKKTLGKGVSTKTGGCSFHDDEGHDGIPFMPCSKFRYMPASPAQTSQTVSCADAFLAGRGVPSENIHQGYYAECRNCHKGHHEHDPETERCSVAYDDQVGNGKFQSAWECSVCNQRWEDHETAFEIESEYKEKAGMSGMQRARSSTDVRGEPRTRQGELWGARAAEIGSLLDDNSYGVSRNYKDADHYDRGLHHGHGFHYRSFAKSIEEENVLLREQEAELERQRRLQGAGGITYIDTTTAYKEGKGAMYGDGVGDERGQYPTSWAMGDGRWGRPTSSPPSSKVTLPRVQSTGMLRRRMVDGRMVVEQG